MLFQELLEQCWKQHQIALGSPTLNLNLVFLTGCSIKPIKSTVPYYNKLGNYLCGIYFLLVFFVFGMVNSSCCSEFLTDPEMSMIVTFNKFLVFWMSWKLPCDSKFLIAPSNLCSDTYEQSFLLLLWAMSLHFFI